MNKNEQKNMDEDLRFSVSELVAADLQLASGLALVSAKEGRWERVKAFIAAGVSPASSFKGQSLGSLIWSDAPQDVVAECAKLHPELIEGQAGRKTTALFEACRRGSSELFAITLNLAKDDPKKLSKSSETMEGTKMSPLSLCAKEGKTEELLALLDAGASAAGAKSESMPPIGWAAGSSRKGSEKALELLLAAGAQPDARVCFERGDSDAKGMKSVPARIRPLGLAAMAGSKEKCAALMAAGADPWKNFSGWPEDPYGCAMWAASIAGQTELLDMMDPSGAGAAKLACEDKASWHRSVVLDAEEEWSFAHSDTERAMSALRLSDPTAWAQTKMLTACAQAGEASAAAWWIERGALAETAKLFCGKEAEKITLENAMLLAACAKPAEAAPRASGRL